MTPRGFYGAALLATVSWLAAATNSTASAQDIAPTDAPDLVEEPGRRLFSDALPRWDLGGSNSVSFDYYDSFGDETASPYPFDGGQFVDELSLRASRRVSPYERLRADLAATVNESDYRGNEKGFVLERGNLFWEKGDARVPLRAEGGDIFAYTSFRTMQRSLKGAQLELQPTIGGGGQSHSIMLFSGDSSPDYRTLDDEVDVYSGASWLIEDAGFGAFNLSLVHNVREADGETGLPRRGQAVASLAWQRGVALAGQELDVEVEYAHLRGDIESGGGVSEDVDDDGVFAEINGRDDGLPLSYSAKFERYGGDYRPNGAAISPDRRTVEARAGWLFERGLSLRGRVQSFRDGLDTSNPTDTEIAGVTLSGPIAPQAGVSLNLDGFVRSRNDADDTVDDRSVSVRLDLAAPLGDRLSGRLGLAADRTRDLNGDPTTITRSLSTSVSYDFTADDWQASVSPGLVLRRTTGGSSDDSEITPTLDLRASKDNHSFSFSHSLIDRDIHVAGGTDLRTNQTALRYGYQWGAHRLGLEADYYDRAPSPGDGTEALRVGLVWTVALQRPPVRRPVTRAAAPPSGGASTPPDILDLAPGANMMAIRLRLAASRISTPLERPGLMIFETRLLPEINRRQRLVLAHDGGKLERSGVIITFQDGGAPDTAFQVFEEVRELLLRRYGRPDRRIETGDFGPGLSRRLRSGDFQRMLEWETPAGRLRFGIPVRTDGAVRLEIVHARGFPPGERGDWGFDRVQ